MSMALFHCLSKFDFSEHLTHKSRNLDCPIFSRNKFWLVFFQEENVEIREKMEDLEDKITCEQARSAVLKS